MAPRKLQVLLLTLLLTVALSSERAAAAGRSTTTPVNTILNGKGAPKSSLGIDGDFYIDVRSLLIYGPKRKGKWPTPQNLQGPTGASGSDGRNGVDGKSVNNSNVNSVTGPQGLQGAVGPQGEKGEKGEAGLPGAMGPAGLPGAPGTAGANGANGTAGPQGAAGATGASGAVGPSEVAVVEIPSWSLSSATPFSFSASESIGDLKVGASYKFDLFIYGTSVLNNLVLGMDVVSPNASSLFSVIRSDARYSAYSTTSFKYSFLISGTITNIQGQTGISVRAIDAYGETGGGTLIMSGKAYITLVGAIK